MGVLIVLLKRHVFVLIGFLAISGSAVAGDFDFNHLSQNPTGAFNQLRRTFSRPNLSYDNCVAAIKGMNQAVRDSNIGILRDHMAIGSVMPDQNIVTAPMNASQNLFQAAMALRDRMHDYYARGELREEDVQEFWLADRLIRMTDEEIQFFAADVLPFLAGEKLPPKEVAKRAMKRLSREHLENQIMLNPKYQNDFYGPGGLPQGRDMVGDGFDLKGFEKGLRSGDVIVTRGRPKSGVSPAISRIGSSVYEEADISHVFVVYKFVDATGVERTKYIEAMIEDGVSVHDFDYFLDKVRHHKLAKFGVVRFRDQQVASRGAERLYQLVSQMKIAYDFQYRQLKDVLGPVDFSKGWEAVLAQLLDEKRPKELFCSAIAELMILLGSDGQVSVPSHPLNVEVKNDWFLEQFQMKRGPISDPASIMRDPRFDYVAWVRDPVLAHQAHQADAVADVIYEYLDEQDYRIYPNMQARILVNILYPARQIRPDDSPIWNLPLFSFLKKQFPQNVSRDVLRFLASLQNVYNRLRLDLRLGEENFIRQNGRQMTPNERRDFIRNVIETDRMRDWRFSDLWRRRLYHYFSPAIEDPRTPTYAQRQAQRQRERQDTFWWLLP